MLVIIENQKLRTISCTTRFKQHQSANCALLYKRRLGFKHWTFYQPFEIKAQNPCNPWEWRPQNYSSAGRDPVTNCEIGSEPFWGYKEESQITLKNCSMP